MKLTEKKRDRAERNLTAHADAIMAMLLFSTEYGNQGGGVMDFWDQLSETKRGRASAATDRVLVARTHFGRAALKETSHE